MHSPVEQFETPKTKPESAETKVTDAGWKPESFEPDDEALGDPAELETARVGDDGDSDDDADDAVGRLEVDCCGVGVVLEQAAAATAMHTMKTPRPAAFAVVMTPPKQCQPMPN